MNENERMRRELRFFRGYAIVMSVLAAVFLLGAGGQLRSTTFDTVRAHLIEVTDANGDVRLSLFGKEHEPPPLIDGKAFPVRAGGPNADAGLMFYDDRRNEIGGLIFGAKSTGRGAIVQGQSLTFDAYRQDQALQLVHDQEGDESTTGLRIKDAPSVSLVTTIPTIERIQALPTRQQAAAFSALRRRGLLLTPRVFAGVEGRAATLVLRDAKGRPRLTLSVDPSGTPKIDFLDAAGNVVRSIS